jgi:MerR family transcriptional regulator, light-induced transcriptional regulator
MGADPVFLSTRALAEAIGVSESSIKRWVDDGTIRSTRTVGGHRRIQRADAIRFIRDTRATVVAPQILGLAAPVEPKSAPDTAAGEVLTDLLLRGAEHEARAVLESLYVAGAHLAAILDGPFRTALDRIGMIWQQDRAGIFLEHRAVQICVRALSQLSALVPRSLGAPTAVGGAVAGDPYLLPSMAAALILGGEGFDAVNLGADLPTTSLGEAMTRLEARIVWVTVSSATDGPTLGRALGSLVEAAAARGTHVVVGGRAATKVPLSAAPNLYVGSSMAELAAFARGVLANATATEGSGQPKNRRSSGERVR